MVDGQRGALTEQEVAARLGRRLATLRAWRLKGMGPEFVRFGRAVRYLEHDVERFVEACRANGTVHAHAS